MFIPLSGGPRHYAGWPWATLLIVALNVAVFGGEVWILSTAGGRVLSQVIYEWGFTPALVRDQVGWRGLTALTSMYLHGSLGHIFFNLVFLWAFAPLVEEQTGSVRFLMFYTLAGLCGAVLTFFLDPTPVPNIGASGAVAGVMGAFLLLYPGRRVRTLVFVGFPFWPRLPAWLLLGAWVLQAAVAGQAVLDAGFNNTGIGVWAHLGGFAGGLLVILLFLRPDVLFNRRGVV